MLTLLEFKVIFGRWLLSGHYAFNYAGLQCEIQFFSIFRF